MKTKKQQYVDHVVEDGSRNHVLHWDTQGTHCSEPNCETNRIHDEAKKKKKS